MKDDFLVGLAAAIAGQEYTLRFRVHVYSISPFKSPVTLKKVSQTTAYAIRIDRKLNPR